MVLAFKLHCDVVMYFQTSVETDCLDIPARQRHNCQINLMCTLTSELLSLVIHKWGCFKCKEENHKNVALSIHSNKCMRHFTTDFRSSNKRLVQRDIPFWSCHCLPPEGKFLMWTSLCATSSSSPVHWHKSLETKPVLIFLSIKRQSMRKKGVK